MTDTAGITEALPPFLAVEREPKTTPPHCQGCDTDEPPDAEYVTDKGLYLCQACVDGDSDGTMHSTRLEPWRIRSVEEAEWALRKLIEAKEKIAAIDAQANAWTDRIEHWAATQQVKPLERAEFFEGHLQAWARERREADPKVKTIKLPSGEIASRANPARAVVEDPEALVTWLKAFCDEMQMPQDQFIQTVEKPVMAGLKKIVDLVKLDEGYVVAIHGDLVPGVRAEPPSVSVTVKVAS